QPSHRPSGRRRRLPSPFSRLPLMVPSFLCPFSELALRLICLASMVRAGPCLDTVAAIGGLSIPVSLPPARAISPAYWAPPRGRGGKGGRALQRMREDVLSALAAQLLARARIGLRVLARARNSVAALAA